MRRRTLWVALAIVVLALTSVGSAQAVERIVVRIEMGEFYFQVPGQERHAPIVLQAGQSYALVFANVGMMHHEVLIGRHVVVENGTPDGYEVNLLDALPLKVAGDGWEVGVSGFIEVELEPGQEITLEVTMPADLVGDWEIGCFVPGHYQAGMLAPFVIE
jgi:uncharacterized cupredoxin-like copper-binding protein